ncbi:RNA-binding domain-containing protein [Conexibacter sp. CPCC 206217]|uniref:RNA-binding domain-containing protein n=1 Tax=Conexibacter sp. CPCC 206217 TaxID=3064574 RepID=UPI002726C2BF|nr:RNA-binding domain-containing protein [Conexibacter sp. CPCC 206217]MDO8213720.1 ATP-binding protein [Conexibacter sp. CPCC 206217]
MADHLFSPDALDSLVQISAGTRAADLESETLDFKQEASGDGETIRVVVEAAICFANLRGGTIVLGVADDRGGPEAFLGCGLAVDLLRQRIYELTHPALVVSAIEHEHEGKRLLLIQVTEGMEMVSDKKGRSSRRHGTDCLPLGISQAATLNDDRRRFDWSAEPSDLTIVDISRAAVDAARERLRRNTDERRRLADATTADLMGDLGLVREGSLTRAGEVLFCARDEHPPFVYVYRDTPGGEVRTRYAEAKPGLTAYTEVLGRIVDSSAPMPIVLRDGQQLELHDFPLVAVREALSNALLHRDYRQPDPILVDHSPQVLSFVSPGPLVVGVTPANILHVPSKPRNALLARVTHKLGLAEELSRGVDRMYREMIKLGKRPPEITDHPPFSVRVDLTGGAPNQTVARFAATLPSRSQDDLDTMLVLFTLIARQSVTARELAPMLQRGQAATEAVLERLAEPDVELVAPVDRTNQPRWQLSPRALAELRPALSYRTVSADEIDRKIVEFVRKNETVDNKTLQIFFDMDVNGAAYRLRTLVNAGLLQKLGAQRRGPGIQYGPGPNFPKR